MNEKRLATRKNRRLEIRYGTDELQRIAFIGDITPQGFFIQTASVVRPGTLLTVAINLGHSQEVKLKGRVQWAKRVPPQMVRAVKKAGMGIKIHRFLAGEVFYRSFCADLYA